jgi:HD superfamily phosphohydrolase
MKNIKDPIYGYIEINDDYFKLIDDAAFQRLRNIRQTGYQSLYPSAEHTRFVHSLGVFHLGKKAISCFYENLNTTLPPTIKTSWNSIEKTFLVACLLHDVGHSPFSHTGENFYIVGIDFTASLEQALKSNKPDANVSSFSADLMNGGTGKPHEAMSALIGLDLCEQKNFDIDEELFVRAIIGLQYGENTDEARYKNAIITLLNGDLIDVDKLDYIVRDAFVTGFNSMAIDIDRLLAGFTVSRDSVGALCVAYQRKSLSVIENVIYANDLERRWVQSHPVILYDCELLEFAIRNYNANMVKQYNDLKGIESKENVTDTTGIAENAENPTTLGKPAPFTTVFVKDALSATGLSSIGINLRLLCDDDIIDYAKNRDSTVISDQLFGRDRRYKPMWKTEATFEFHVQNLLGDKIIKGFQEDLQSTLDLLQPYTFFFINQTANDALTELTAQLVPDSPLSLLKSYERAGRICNLFDDFKKTLELPDFEFAAITAKKFQSAYKKLTINEIKIELSPNNVVPLESVVFVKGKEIASRDANPNLFYVYTTKDNLEKVSELGYHFIDFVRKNYVP